MQSFHSSSKSDNVRHLAIGNGTASRETEAMAVEMIHKLGGGVSYMIVSEAGASVYSASKLAAEEFPQYDVNLRSAVSIARRLQDPLAELVKIDPKAIGVGQYQHDMPEKELDAALGGGGRGLRQRRRRGPQYGFRSAAAAGFGLNATTAKKTSSPTAKKTVRSPRARRSRRFEAGAEGV